MELEKLRAFALSLPETREQPHHEMSSFRVRGKIFTTVPADGEHLHVFVGEDLTRAATGHDAKTYEELWWGKRLYGIRVFLPTAERDMICDLVEEAWRVKAPKDLLEEYATGSASWD